MYICICWSIKRPIGLQKNIENVHTHTHTRMRTHTSTHGKSASSSLERQSKEADEINLLFCARFYCPGSVCKLQKCTRFSRHHLRPSIYGFKATASGANKQTKPKSKEIKLELVLLDQRMNASLCPIRKWITYTHKDSRLHCILD